MRRLKYFLIFLLPITVAYAFEVRGILTFLPLFVFLPYHNRGHHTNVGTPKDPASARRNEWLFVFWFRSQIGSYIQAWQIETQRMRITKRLWFSLRNKMVVYTLAHLGLLFFIFFNFGAVALIPPLFFRVMNKAADKALSTGQ
jgi:fatty-acid desaturase